MTVVDGNGSTNPLTGVISLAAGDGHTCALTTAGRVWCWGDGDRGQLGNDSTTSSNNPVAVVDGDGSTNPLTNIVALDAGQHHTCAVTSGGGALCWGYGLIWGNWAVVLKLRIFRVKKPPWDLTEMRPFLS